MRDIEQMPAQLNRAAQLKTLGSRPLGVVTAGTGIGAGLDASTRTTWQRLSTHTFHRTVAGSTHQSLIDDPKHAAASSRAIHDVVVAVRDEEGA